MNPNGRVLDVKGGTTCRSCSEKRACSSSRPLPPDGRTTWETVGVFTISEGNGARPNPNGMPRGPNFPRPPGFPGNPFTGLPGTSPAPTTTRKGRERVTYTRTAAAGDVVTIKKNYELKVEGGTTLIGEGRSSSTSRKPVCSGRAISRRRSRRLRARRPSRWSYKLLDGPERDKLVNGQPSPETPQPVVPQKPV